MKDETSEAYKRCHSSSCHTNSKGELFRGRERIEVERRREGQNVFFTLSLVSLDNWRKRSI